MHGLVLLRVFGSQFKEEEKEDYKKLRNEKTRILGIGCQTHTKRNEETEKSIINILLNICMYMFVDRGQKSEKASQLSFSHSLSVNLIHL
jgi:hypothetical protein